MSLLIDLIKIGAIGGALAFLYLAYDLLRSEQLQKRPRKELLRSIESFRGAALIFLIVGVLSEFFLSHGLELLNALNQSLFRKEMVRVRFDTWEYSPEINKVAFSFEENRVDSAGYVLPAVRDKYAVYVGVRRKDVTPAGRGRYDLVFGPYPIANQSHLEKKLTDIDVQSLGTGCVQFTAFGMLKGEESELPLPLNPTALRDRLTVFNSATACIN